MDKERELLLKTQPMIIETKEPEYIKTIDEDNYVYAFCKCMLPLSYAIKWDRIKDGKPHVYKARCRYCNEVVSVVSKTFGREILDTLDKYSDEGEVKNDKRV